MSDVNTSDDETRCTATQHVMTAILWPAALESYCCWLDSAVRSHCDMTAGLTLTLCTTSNTPTTHRLH